MFLTSGRNSKQKRMKKIVRRFLETIILLFSRETRDFKSLPPN